jgi:hypothetical protein
MVLEEKINDYCLCIFQKKIAGSDELNSDNVVFASGYAFRGETPLVNDALEKEIGDVFRKSDIDKTLENLNGSYWAIHISLNKLGERTLSIVTDRFGSRPIYFGYDSKGILYIGDDYWAICEKLISPTININAAFQLLTYEYALGECTIVNEINEIQSGTIAKFNISPVGQCSLHSHLYWFYDSLPQIKDVLGKGITDFNSICERIQKRFCNLAEIINPNGLAVNLTHGMDSRFVAMLLERSNTPKYLSTLSGDGDSGNKIESDIAHLLSRPHIQPSPWWHDESNEPSWPIVWSLAPTTSISVANNPNSISINAPWEPDGFWSGHLGDRPAGSCIKLREVLCNIRKDKEQLIETYRKKQLKANPRDIKNLFKNDAREMVQDPWPLIKKRLMHSSISSTWAIGIRLDLEQRQRRFILRDYLALQSIGPSALVLMDYELQDLLRSLPYKWLLDRAFFKTATHKYYEKKCPELNGIPTNGELSSVILHPCLNFMGKAIKDKIRNMFLKTSSPHSLPEKRYTIIDDLPYWKDGLEEIMDMDLFSSWYSQNQHSQSFRQWTLPALFTVGMACWRIKGGNPKLLTRNKP